MKKIYVCLTIVLLSFAPVAAGQGLHRLLSTDNQNLIALSTIDCFCVARQEFQLQDSLSGTRYNLDSLAYFGYAESICIKTAEGMIVSKSMLEPWLNDPNIASFPEYKPVLSSFSIYDRKSSEWEKSGVTVTDDIHEWVGTENVLLRDSLLMNCGFQTDTSLQKKEGWILYLMKDGLEVSITPVKQELAVKDTCAVYPLEETFVPDGCRFGVYVVPDCSTPGSVVFRISALLEKSSDGWTVIPMCMSHKQKTAVHKLVEVVEKSPSDNLSGKNASKNRKKRK